MDKYATRITQLVIQANLVNQPIIDKRHRLDILCNILFILLISSRWIGGESIADINLPIAHILLYIFILR